jgi:hypothetical protein
MANGSSIKMPVGAMNQGLAQLKTQIATYRHEKRPGERIPQVIRHAVLDALAHGVSAVTMQRELGITSSQISYWRRDNRSTACKRELRSKKPQVFSVTRGAEPVMGSGADELALCIGPWRVTLSHAAYRF